jgi:hypothetical protein
MMEEFISGKENVIRIGKIKRIIKEAVLLENIANLKQSDHKLCERILLGQNYFRNYNHGCLLRRLFNGFETVMKIDVIHILCK